MVNLFNFSYLLATCFGFGLLSWVPAPGTLISLLSIILWYILNILLSWKVLFFLLLLLTIFGCYFCHRANQDIGIHDHKCIVLDEFIGMWYVLILSPNIINNSMLLVFIGFLFFRVFDICKPWPISYIDQNIKNGFGIVFDDIVAAIFSIVLIFLIEMKIYFLCYKNFNIMHKFF